MVAEPILSPKQAVDIDAAEDANEVTEAARGLFGSGILTFPASAKAKHPDRVKHWAAEHYPPKGWPTEQQHEQMFAQRDIERMFVVCGARSGNVAALDFDQKGYFEQWAALIPYKLCDRLHIEQSQRSGGYHVAFKTTEAVPSCIPARDPRKPDGTGGDVRIEVRGEGNGFMATPGVGYQWIQGDLANLPILTPDEYQVLLDAAAGFNECEPRPQMERQPRQLRPADSDELPGTRYNRENGQAEVLALFQQHEWEVGRRDHSGNVSITRPDATSDTSGNVSPDGVTHIFSTNTPFEPSAAGQSNPYSPFAVYAVLEHGEDYRAAGKALHKRYYPQPKYKERADPANVTPIRSDRAPLNDMPLPKRPYTDLGNAERLIDRYGRELRYVVETGKWAVWQENHWALDDTGQIDRHAKGTVRGIYREAADTPAGTATAELGKHAVKSEAAARIAAMINLAWSEPGIAIHIQDFDTDPFLLNCMNGVIDLRTGSLQTHDRAELHMKRVPVPYDCNATAPTWDAFLAWVLPDEATRRFVQRAVGYSLTASTREQKFFLLYGDGSNGKSTFLETLATVLSDYAQSATMDTFTVKKSDSAIPNDIARMVGARLITAVETNDGVRLNESLIKQLTGGDRISARFLHKEFFDFHPTHKLWISVNHKPVIKGTDHAIWRRPVLIPFTITIPDEEQDKLLPAKLCAELPGILAWAVQGCLDWQRDGLLAPEAVREATDEYRAGMDVLASFFEDRCTIQRTASATAEALYEAYKEWCTTNGERFETSQSFGRRLKERKLKQGKERGQRCWFGIGLITEGVQSSLEIDDSSTADPFHKG